MPRTAVTLLVAIVLVTYSVPLRAQRTAGELADDAKARQSGVLPVGDDGKPLNLDFETGDLRDWTSTGAAFVGQPIRATRSTSAEATCTRVTRASSGSARMRFARMRRAASSRASRSRSPIRGRSSSSAAAPTTRA